MPIYSFYVSLRGARAMRSVVEGRRSNPLLREEIASPPKNGGSQ